jgi:O-antigen/teichoic acid export membrane protein
MVKNIIANFVGKFWSLLSVFIFVPLYIQILGFESYAIISFMLVIAGVVTVLDAGLTATLSREFARADISQEMKSKTLVTLESIYVLIIGLVIVGIFSFSGLIAGSWLNSESFTNSELTWFLRFISFDVAFQMLFRFYVGGVLGLEKQVFANVLQVGWGVLRNGLVVIAIWLSPNLNTFFIWQAISTVVFAVLAKVYLKKLLNNSNGYEFSFSWQIDSQTLHRIWKFAGGMMLISLVAALNSQMDKIAISKLLPIETLGHYTLAVSLSMALVTLVNPIAVALLPRFYCFIHGTKVR